MPKNVEKKNLNFQKKTDFYSMDSNLMVPITPTITYSKQSMLFSYKMLKNKSL